MSGQRQRCIECFQKDRRHCAPGGLFDPALLAHSYLEYIDRSESSRTNAEELFWAFMCLSDLEHNDPERAYDVLLVMIDALTTPHQASVVAAGTLEVLIADHGPQFIGRIETLAKQSLRFRYVLSGVWLLENSDAPEWQRVAELQKSGPHLDRNDDIPASDIPA